MYIYICIYIYEEKKEDKEKEKKCLHFRVLEIFLFILSSITH